MRDLEPPPKGYHGLPSYVHRLWQFVMENCIRRSPGTLIRRSSRGTLITAFEEDFGLGSDAGLNFKGQYDPDVSYDVDDIVICELDAELDDGRRAGTYIAIQAVVPGDAPPGADVQNASLGVLIGGGVITQIDPAAPNWGGKGYVAGTSVTITGDGSGAVAHIEDVDEDGAIVQIVVDNGGTGYTSATATVPNRVQKWADFALGRWKKLTIRAGSRVLILDAGRDADTDLSLTIKDLVDADVGSVTILLSDIPVGAGDKDVRLREEFGCDYDTFTQRKKILLSSDWYD